MSNLDLIMADIQLSANILIQKKFQITAKRAIPIIIRAIWTAKINICLPINLKLDMYLKYFFKSYEQYPFVHVNPNDASHWFAAVHICPIDSYNT